MEQNGRAGETVGTANGVRAADDGDGFCHLAARSRFPHHALGRLPRSKVRA